MLKDNFSGDNNIWNERFSSQKNLYTASPNHHFAIYLKNKKPGRILLPGDGEGRNGVFAAKAQWKVTTFDYSQVGVDHSNELARLENVKIQAINSSIIDFHYKQDYFDVIAIIFLHLPLEIRKIHFPRLMGFLKSGGELFLLGFNKNQIHLSSGGPKSIEMLFNIEELTSDFRSLKINRLEEFRFTLNEGPKHQGEAELIEFIGVKH